MNYNNKRYRYINDDLNEKIQENTNQTINDYLQAELIRNSNKVEEKCVICHSKYEVYEKTIFFQIQM